MNNYINYNYMTEPFHKQNEDIIVSIICCKKNKPCKEHITYNKELNNNDRVISKEIGS